MGKNCFESIVFSGNGWWCWAEPKVWEIFCAHSLDDVSVFHHLLQSAEQFSGTKGSQHLRVLQTLLPRAKERNRHCTKCAGLHSMASQVFFSIWEGVWGTLPSFPFYLGILGSFYSKAWKQNGISTPLWNISALALVGSHQSIQEKLSQGCSASQYTGKDIWFQFLEGEFTSSSKKQRFDRWAFSSG